MGQQHGPVDFAVNGETNRQINRNKKPERERRRYLVQPPRSPDHPAIIPQQYWVTVWIDLANIQLSNSVQIYR